MAGEAKTRNLVLVVGAARDFPLRSVSYVRWFSVLSAMLWIPIGFLWYLLLGALSPVLHVEGSGTRPGIIEVSRYLFFLTSFFAVVDFYQTFFTFAPFRLEAIV
jgi:hypothetical protein